MTPSTPTRVALTEEGSRTPSLVPCLVLAALALILRSAMPYLPVPSHPVTDIIGGMVYMVVVLATAIELGARPGSNARLATYGLLAAGAVFAASAAGSQLLGAAYLERLASGKVSGFPEGRVPAVLWIIGSVKDVALIIFAVLGGALLSRIARESKLLLPIGVTAAVVDGVGVLYRGGFTAQVLERNPELVQAFAASVPAVGAAGVVATGGVHPGLALGFVGIGDFLFIGFFFAAGVRFCLNFPAARAGVMAASLLAFGLVLLGNAHMPGLPFIVAGAILPNLGHFRYTRQEMVALAIGGLFLVVLCAAMVLWGASAAPTGPPMP